MVTPIVIGHRGASGLAPENTLLSFQTAHSQGADMIELDLQESSDGHLVVIHDYDVSRLTDGTGLVSEHTIEELRKLNCKGGQKIPLLEEVLKFAKHRIKVNIELKTLGIEEKALEMVEREGMLNEVVFSSFFHATLENLRQFDDRAKTAALFSSNVPDDAVNRSFELGAIAINPIFTETSRTLVKQAHAIGMRVYPWTVNDEDDMIRLIHLNVDGIITDFPGVCRNLLNRLEANKQL